MSTMLTADVTVCPKDSKGALLQLIRCGLPAVLLGAGLCAACNDPFDVGSLTETIIVAAGDSGRLAVLSGPAGRIVARPGPVPLFQDAYALTPDGENLYFTAQNTVSDRVLLRLSTRSFAITSSITLAELEGRSAVPGLSLTGNYSLAFSPDGSRLLLADAVRDGITGIAVLDATTLTPTAFLGPFSVEPDGLAATRPTSAVPAGQLFAVGTRTPGVFPRADSLFVLDGSTLEILEALPVVQPAADGLAIVFDFQLSPDGERVYVLGRDQLLAYDLTTRQLVGATPAPGSGSIGVAPDGSAVYVTDPGDNRNFPGSGLVLVFGPTLEPRQPIDLRQHDVNGIVPVTAGITVGRDGKYVYITSGTGSRGPLFGTQPRRVFVIDATSREVVHDIPLDDYGAGPLFVVR